MRVFVPVYCDLGGGRPDGDCRSSRRFDSSSSRRRRRTGTAAIETAPALKIFAIDAFAQILKLILIILTAVLVSCDLLIRLTLWKFENVSKLSDFADLVEHVELAEDTEDTPEAKEKLEDEADMERPPLDWTLKLEADWGRREEVEARPTVARWIRGEKMNKFCSREILSTFPIEPGAWVSCQYGSAGVSGSWPDREHIFKMKGGLKARLQLAATHCMYLSGSFFCATVA